MHRNKSEKKLCAKCGTRRHLKAITFTPAEGHTGTFELCRACAEGAMEAIRRRIAA